MVVTAKVKVVDIATFSPAIKKGIDTNVVRKTESWNLLMKNLDSIEEITVGGESGINARFCLNRRKEGKNSKVYYT